MKKGVLVAVAGVILLLAIAGLSFLAGRKSATKTDPSSVAGPSSTTSFRSPSTSAQTRPESSSYQTANEPEYDPNPSYVTHDWSDDVSPAGILMYHPYWGSDDGKAGMEIDVEDDEAVVLFNGEVYFVTEILDIEGTVDNFDYNMILVLEAVNGGYEASCALYCYQDRTGDNIQVVFGDLFETMKPVETSLLDQFKQ